jgi:hypothetical protein
VPTVVIAATAADAADARGTGAAYPPAFTTSDNGLPVSPTRSKPSLGGFTVEVGLLRFDTSSIPDTATVEQAVLKAQIARKDNSDGRQLTADWYDFAGTVDAGDFTATAGVDAHAGTPVSTFPAYTVSPGTLQVRPGRPGSLFGVRPVYILPVGVTSPAQLLAFTQLALLDPAGHVSKTDYTGLRLHISGGSPAGSNCVYVFNPQLIVTYAETGQAGGEDPQTGGTSADPQAGAPYVQPTASRRAPRLAVPWALVLSDRTTKPITIISRVALDKKLAYRRSRPATLSFRVPSDDPQIARIHTDGIPVLHPLARTVQAYRHEQDDDGTFRWVLRFNGVVWQLEDAGEPDDAWTAVVCFDPWKLLEKRFPTLDPFVDVDGAAIARQIVDQVNSDEYTGVQTDGGTFEQAPVRTKTYAGRQSAGAALAELANAFDGFDLLMEPFTPEDSTGAPVYDGTMARLHAFTKLGRWQDELKFSWGAAPHNVKSVRRLLDGEGTANRILGLGQSSIAGPIEDPESRAAFGLLESVSSYTDIVSPELLQALIASELQFRKRTRELVHIIPQPGLAPEPFTHVNLGDTFEVYIGERLRGGLAGLQRCYGFDISLSDDVAIETVDRYVTTPNE